MQQLLLENGIWDTRMNFCQQTMGLTLILVSRIQMIWISFQVILGIWIIFYNHKIP